MNEPEDEMRDAQDLNHIESDFPSSNDVNINLCNEIPGDECDLEDHLNEDDEENFIECPSPESIQPFHTQPAKFTYENHNRKPPNRRQIIRNFGIAMKNPVENDSVDVYQFVDEETEVKNKKNRRKSSGRNSTGRKRRKTIENEEAVQEYYDNINEYFDEVDSYQLDFE